MKTAINDTQGNQHIEKEMKVLETFHKDLEDKIFQLGGESLGTKELVALWLQHPETKEKVRVRKEGNGLAVEHKKFIESVDSLKGTKGGENGEKVKKAIETNMEDSPEELFQKLGISSEYEKYKERINLIIAAGNFEAAEGLFRDLGFISANRKSVKMRVSYVINHPEDGRIQFDFDAYSDLDGMIIPELLEIEAKNEATIRKYALLLGIDESKLLNWGAGKLAAYYREILTNQK